MFFTINRQSLLALIYATCIVCIGNLQEQQHSEVQKQELADVFIEKVEYVYDYLLWFTGADLGFTDNGYRKKALQVVLYWKDGVYYFVPLEACNDELEIGGVSRKVSCIEQKERYEFYTLQQGMGDERDDGIWYLQQDTSVRHDNIEGFIYLGTVKIDTSGEEKPETTQLSENGYIHAIVDRIRELGNLGDLPTGNYKIYIGDYGYSTANSVRLNGVIRQGSTYRCFDGWVDRYGDSSYKAAVWSTNGASERFPTTEEITSAHEDARYIVEAERLVLDLEITGQAQGNAEVTDQTGRDLEEMTVEGTGMVTAEEAENKIQELYNYYHWFYGSVPHDIESLLEEGKVYDIYTDGNGNVFWAKEGKTPHKGSVDSDGGIYRLEGQTGLADLPVYSYVMGETHQAELQKIGKMEWHKPELVMPKLPFLEEDDYIREVKAYIENMLSQKKKHGKYQIYFGRYEILRSDVRSISVAVTGEDTFYLQCWVTEYPDGPYECFPVNGSYMGEEKSGLKKADRIVQLGRLRMELEI